MCFGGGNKKAQEKQNKKAAEERVEAEEVKREEVEERAEQKREDISEAISEKQIQAGRRGRGGGRGRRSLFRSSGGASGFLGRFNY